MILKIKKSQIVIFIFTLLFCTQGFAKTEGNYVGINVLNTTFESYDSAGKTFDDSSFGVGLDYKYAVNFDGFFVSPGLFYNFNDSNVDFADSAIPSTRYNDELKNSYGVKLDLGYDITDKFALFGIVGFQESRIIYESNSVESSRITQESLVYGIGAKYGIYEAVDLNIAYEVSKYDVNNLVVTTPKMDIEVLRAGVSYNF